VAFSTFGEATGQDRVSIGGRQQHALQEVGGPIERLASGPFSGFSASLNGRQYFAIPYDETGDLNICGPEAQVSMFAVVRLTDLDQSRTIAGMWSEGRVKAYINGVFEPRELDPVADNREGAPTSRWAHATQKGPCCAKRRLGNSADWPSSTAP
jgi:hypothetical protein